jgi:hypothetical protein
MMRLILKVFYNRSNLSCNLLGVTDGSAIVGVALCGHDGRRGYIYHLAVHLTVL